MTYYYVNCFFLCIFVMTNRIIDKGTCLKIRSRVFITNNAFYV